MIKSIIFNFRTPVILIALFSGIIPGQSSAAAPGQTLIFPLPQQMEITGDVFIPDESISIVVPRDAGKRDIFLARFLVRELSDKYGIAVRIENRSDIPSGRKTVIMGRFDNQLVRTLLKENKLDVSAKNPGPEGYILQVTPERVIIAGSDDAGAYYGLQSLRQLLNAGEGRKVQGVKVKDWPNYPFRAIRLYVPGPENISYFRRFMRDFMSLYKYNKVVIEFNCMRLDRHPEVNAGWIEFSKYMQYTRSNETKGLRGETKNSAHYDAGDGFIIEKNDVREIVNYAEENFLEVIPEIPSLTHGYYLLTRHPELAEYPGDRWPDTYCPSNPDSYKLMFDVLDEYIEVIKPKMVHIGHDEWWGAPLEVCPLCKGKDYSELFAGDIKKIYDYLAAKGIKTAMWGDFLLESVRGKGPAQKTSSTGVKFQTPGGLRPEVVKKSIPKDILIFNWFWNKEDKEQELQQFGFKQIFGNFTPEITNWKERVRKIDLLGGAPSAWASTNEFNFGKDLVYDFLGCANYLWSDHIIGREELASVVPELIPSIRSYLSVRRIPGKDGDAVEPLNISSVFNLPKEPKVFNINLNALKPGIVTRGAIKFDLAGPENSPGKCAVAVGSKGTENNPFPAVIEGIPVNEDVSSLIFLHACALPSKNQKAYFNIPDFFDSADLLGWYEVIYEDGFKSVIPVQYGVNILEYNRGTGIYPASKEEEKKQPDDSYCYEADPVVCSSDPDRDPVTFYAFEWTNPRFGKKIREISMHGTVNYQATQTVFSMPVTKPMKSNVIMLAGITRVKKRELFVPSR